MLDHRIDLRRCRQRAALEGFAGFLPIGQYETLRETHPRADTARSLIEPHRLIRTTLENSARRRAWVKSRDESQRNTIDAAVPSGRVQTRAAARLS